MVFVPDEDFSVFSSLYQFQTRGNNQSHHLPDALFHVVLSWFTTTLPTALCPCFWRPVSWIRLFDSDICDSFLSDSEETVLVFPLCPPKVYKMSFLSQAHSFVCYQLQKLIKCLYIYEITRSWRTKYAFFLLPER